VTPGDSPLALDPIARPSVADQVFDTVHDQIVSLALLPGTKLSETEVASALGTSRQPVRDAFFRLSKQGFLDIRPQRITRVSLISVDRVLEARFVRTALEVETIRLACARIKADDVARLRANLDDQARAVAADDRARFHALDDAFHRQICIISGHPFAWQTIGESKAHLDRARLLSLSFNQQRTLEEHRAILDALEQREADRAVDLMRQHLSRLETEIGRIREENVEFFAD
jgi:DNA-binding GntR family transcriptional regulator